MPDSGIQPLLDSSTNINLFCTYGANKNIALAVTTDIMSLRDNGLSLTSSIKHPASSIKKKVPPKQDIFSFNDLFLVKKEDRLSAQ
jgi:hypothetical protein